MKKITLICLLMASFSSFGQPTEKEGEEIVKRIIGSSTYIFEATVVPNTSTAYFTPDSTVSYGSYLLDVHRVYRGNLVLGTVQVIFAGADIAYTKNGERRSIQHSNGGYGLSGTNKFVIFAKDTDYPSHPSGVNTLAVNPQKIVLTEGGGSTIMWPDNDRPERFSWPVFSRKFETEKEVYKYLRSFSGIVIPDSVYNKAATKNPFLEQKKKQELEQARLVKEAATPAVEKKTKEDRIQDKISHYKIILWRYDLMKKHRQEDHPKEVAEAEEQLKYWEDVLEKYKKKELTDGATEIILNKTISGIINSSRVNAPASSEEFTWHITNQKFSSNRIYYEFDVTGKVNASNIYLDGVELYIDYNTALFGNSITAANKITITNGPLYSNDYYLPVHADMTNNTELIRFFATTTTSRPDRVARLMAANTDELLFHVKITLNSVACNVSTGLSYNTSLINQNLSFNTFGLSASISNELSFSKINVDAFPSVNTCQLFISSIVPNTTPVIAGKNSTITITGSGFGNTRGTGKLQFKNADDGGANYLPSFDAPDYKNWSDNSITVNVPSAVFSSKDPQTGKIPSAGTGKIKITNDQGVSVESVDEVKIDYSLLNYTAFYPDKYRYYLRNQDASGGITFHLGTGVSNNPQARAAIIKALDEWSCNLKIDLKLGADISAGDIEDGQNVIYSSTTLSAPETINRLKSCGVSIGDASTYNEHDIGINFSTNWYYDGGNVPNGKYDFYAAILHEIGHALGLRHVNDPKDLMYWALSTTGTTSSNRKTVLNAVTAKTGAVDMVTTSKQLTWLCSTGGETTRTLTDATVPRNCDGFVVGLYDHVDLIAASTLFKPGDNVSYTGFFYSKNGDTYPTQWNWALKLYHGGGAYTYASSTTNTTIYYGNEYRWSFTANASLPDYAWVRTENGWIYGELSVYTIDNNGYKNDATTTRVEVKYKPNKPEITQYKIESGVIQLIYSAQGATAYKIYYGTDPYSYSGTGATEGNSPINAGANTLYTLSGLNLSTQRYAVSIIASNSEGTSVYSSPAYTLPSVAPIGSTLSNPIDLGTIQPTVASITKNNHPFYGFGNDYTGQYNQPCDDIFYRFFVAGSAKVQITTQGSNIYNYIHLLDGVGNHLLSNNSYYSSTTAIINTDLSPGYYYLVVEGLSDNSGSITSNINTVVVPPTSTGAGTVTVTTPAPISSGSLVTFTGSPINGATYKWYAYISCCGWVNANGYNTGQSYSVNLSSSMTFRRDVISPYGSFQGTPVTATIGGRLATNEESELSSNDDSYSLEQNLPNPAESFTVVNYNTPATAKDVKILVIDIFGKGVAQHTLTDHKGSVTISTIEMPNGLYIYSLVVDGNLMKVKKMLVVK